MKYLAIIIFLILQGDVFTDEPDPTLNTVEVDDNLLDSNKTTPKRGDMGNDDNGTLPGANGDSGKNDTAAPEKGKGPKLNSTNDNQKNDTVTPKGKESNDTISNNNKKNDTVTPEGKEGNDTISNDNQKNDTVTPEGKEGNDTISNDNKKNDTVTPEGKEGNDTILDNKKKDTQFRGDEGKNCTGSELSSTPQPPIRSSDGTGGPGGRTPVSAEQPFVCPYARRRQTPYGSPGRPRPRLPSQIPKPIDYVVFKLHRDPRVGVTVSSRCFGRHLCQYFNDGKAINARSQLNNPYSSILRIAALKIM